MKKDLLFLLIAAMLSPSVIYAQHNMKVVYFDNFAPYSWVDKQNKQVRGLMIDILNEAIQSRMGINLSHEGYPWKRAQSLVKSGKAELLLP